MYEEQISDLKQKNRFLEGLKLVYEKNPTKITDSIELPGYENTKNILTNIILKSTSHNAYTRSESSKKFGLERDDFIKMINGELLSTAIHINGTLKELSYENKNFSERQLLLLEKIAIKSTVVMKMLRDISTMHKISTGDLSLIRNTHDLTSIVAKTIKKIRDEVVVNDYIITETLIPFIACYCDKDKIEQVITQILLNSIDFSPKGSTIDVQLGSSDKCAELVIKDNGIGIEENNLEKIFEPFKQLDITMFTKYRAAGLGLTICKAIVEQHGGKIWAHSKGIGSGTVVHILLPLNNKSEEIRKIE